MGQCHRRRRTGLSPARCRVAHGPQANGCRAARAAAATANIYWYGLTPAVSDAKKLHTAFFHTPADDQRLAAMVSRIAADLFCFQEIVDVARFEQVLRLAKASLTLRDAAGHAVSSSAVSPAPSSTQRTVLAWDTHSLRLLDWQPLAMWTRAPVAAHFEHKATGRRFRVVGVHAKSSAPESEDTAGHKKRQELAALAHWASGETAAGRLGEALILGDLNATSRGEDARHLKQGALADWRWDEASGDEASRWTTTTDRVVIDHILVSPSLSSRVRLWPEIVYIDRDDGLALGAEAPVPNILKRLTDHRPVRMQLDMA